MTTKAKTPAKKATIKKTSNNADAILQIVLKTLEDGKAEDILQIPLEGKSSIADYMIIASGSSSRQVSALADNTAFNLKKAGFVNSLEGKAGGSWVIVDVLDVIVHIFHPDTRAFYALEEIWNTKPKTRPSDEEQETEEKDDLSSDEPNSVSEGKED